MARKTATAAALALAGALAFGPGPATAQPQGYFGPGRDGDYQPPAYDRDRIGPDRNARQGRTEGARSASGGGLYSGPLYDREPYGYGYSGAGADRMRPDRSEMERADRAQFERGHRLGREDERYRLRAQAAHARVLNNGVGTEQGAASGLDDDDRDVAALLLAHSRQQRAMQDVRQSLQEARAAIQQNDRARAETALAQADQKLRMAGPGVGGNRLAVGWVNQAELALERGDQEAARRAMREARQAVRSPGEEPQQAQGQRSADPGGGGDRSGSGGGVRPQQGDGQQQGATAGAGGPPAR